LIRSYTLSGLLAVVMLAVAFVLPGVAADAPQRLPVEPLVIETSSGPVTFQTEIADEDHERGTGMMFRRTMAETEAMLFIWPEPEPVAMWMRNTFVSLDMLFIDGTGTIVHIAREAVPQSLDVISAGRDVPAVLEIKGGAAQRLGIAVGDKVKHRAFAAP
jgi:uncharacterized protein